MFCREVQCYCDYQWSEGSRDPPAALQPRRPELSRAGRAPVHLSEAAALYCCPVPILAGQIRHSSCSSAALCWPLPWGWGTVSRNLAAAGVLLCTAQVHVSWLSRQQGAACKRQTAALSSAHALSCTGGAPLQYCSAAVSEGEQDTRKCYASVEG